MSEDQFPDYSYSGWLVFNELFDVEQHNEGRTAIDILDSLPEYESGSPSEPSRGFKTDAFPDEVSQVGDLTYDLEEFADGLHSLKYIDEDWVQEWGYDENGNEQLFYKQNHESIDIFWHTESQIMMLRGDKNQIGKRKEQLIEGFSGELKLDSIDFDFDFFLWILYKEHKDEELTSDLRVRQLTRGATIGDRKDNLGKQVEVRDSKNILRSLMLIAPILTGNKIEEIQGTFVFGTKQIQAKVEYGGKIHVVVSDSPLSRMSDLRRMALSIRFMSELLQIFEYWKNLNNDKKYPPPSFFDELADVAEQEGWDLTYDPEEVKDEYRRKRDTAVEAEDDVSSTAPGQDLQ